MSEGDIGFLEGLRLRLRPLEEKDADGPYVSWLNDPEVCRWNSHRVYPYSRVLALDYIRHANSTGDDLILACALKCDGRHIGNVALQSINLITRSAEFAILLGEKSAWGNGYGLEAGKLLLRHGFTALNLNRIAAATYEGNIGMRKLALALGMVEEGTRREAAFKDGRYVNIIEFGVLRGEFLSRWPDDEGQGPR